MEGEEEEEEEEASHDVLKLTGLRDEEGCRELLEGLVRWDPGEDGEGTDGEGGEDGDAGTVSVAEGVAVSARRVVLDDLAPVSVLTWNIDGMGKSRLAPESFVLAEKLAIVQLEILRWAPEVVALQECDGDVALEALCKQKYDFVGAAVAHRGYVQLYVKKGVRWGRRQVVEGLPAVLAEVAFAGKAVCVAGVHLEPHAEGVARRREQLRGVLAAMWGASVMVLGDLNARDAEVEELISLRGEGLEDMLYLGRSWDMRENAYFEEYTGQGSRAPAMSFDRILCVGARCARRVICWGRPGVMRRKRCSRFRTIMG